jgi:long-chain acyl-CoA synthetase
VSGNLDVSSLCEAFQRSAAMNPDGVALRTPGGAVEITWREYGERVGRVAAGLAALGVQRGHTVAMMMSNRPEFNICDTAAMHLGATPFSVYNTLAPEQIAYLFSNAENRVVICESVFVDRVVAAGGKVEHIVCVDGAEGWLSLADLEAMGDPGFAFDAAWRAVGPDDVLTLIYTSGTTGPPKGVEITHANMLAEIAATASVLPVTREDRIASYLPSAHVADRWSSHYQQMVFGLQITCVADIKTIAAALADIRPTLWGGVPRVWEKIKAALEARIESEADPQRKQGMQWAIATGIKKVRAEQAAINGEGPGPDEALLAEYAKADELVLSKIRQQIGLDDVHWSIIGAAPASMDVLEFFGAIGLPICELWGMSELSCCATINPPARNKLGTVGRALPGVELATASCSAGGRW